MNLSEEIATIKTIARMAASVCQTIQEELTGPAFKDGREPVTIADYASQAVIGSALAENFPEDGVISEERSEEFMLLLDDRQRALVQRYVTDALGGYVFEEQVCAWLDFGKQSQAPRRWIVDPIDGTKGFLAGRHYCVAISLLEGDEPVLGVLASPGFYSDDDPVPAEPGALIAAAQGQGAFLEPLYGGPAEPLHVSATGDPQTARLLTSFEPEHTDRRLLDQVSALLGREVAAPVRSLDGQDKYGMVAAGIGDLYLRAVPNPAYWEKLWDHAAGYVIVREAGGQVTDLRGSPLDWRGGARMTRNRGVLVTNGVLHPVVLAAIERSGLV